MFLHGGQLDGGPGYAPCRRRDRGKDEYRPDYNLA